VGQFSIKKFTLIQERLNNAKADNSISHEEMMQRIDERRAKQKAQFNEEKEHD
jgi:hypothetical protein